MDASAATSSRQIQTVKPPQEEPPTESSYQLQKLSQRHKEALSLLAQGERRQLVAEITQFSPEYLTWLIRQTVCKTYLEEIRTVVDFRMESLTEESADAIQEVLRNGKPSDRIAAAKLQLEVVGRVGAGRGQGGAALPGDHLAVLADRLVNLMKQTRQGDTVEGQFTMTGQEA